MSAIYGEVVGVGRFLVGDLSRAPYHVKIVFDGQRHGEDPIEVQVKPEVGERVRIGARVILNIADADQP